MGWISIPTTINIEILRLWNRMIKTKIDTTKLLFNYEINLEGKWSKNVLEILKSIGQEAAFCHKSTVNLKFCQELMLQLNQQEWINACKQKPKLRTYIKFKQEYKMEKYTCSISQNMNGHCALNLGLVFYLCVLKLADIDRNK